MLHHRYGELFDYAMNGFAVGVDAADERVVLLCLILYMTNVFIV